MVIRSADRTSTVQEHVRGGLGHAIMNPIVPASFLGDKGKLFNVVTLERDCEVGFHQHVCDCEVYFILSGEGELNDNGVITTVSAGDVVFTDDGESHSILNRHDEPLSMVALVLNK